MCDKLLFLQTSSNPVMYLTKLLLALFYGVAHTKGSVFNKHKIYNSVFILGISLLFKKLTTLFFKPHPVTSLGNLICKEEIGNPSLSDKAAYNISHNYEKYDDNNHQNNNQKDTE